MDKARTYQRRLQVLEILKKSGPLSIRTLEACIRPHIQRRKLREVLQRLHERGLLKKRYDRVFGGAGVYYQIAQAPSARMAVGQLLSVDPSTLLQPHFSHARLLHSENCAVWLEIFQHLIPDSRILREHEIGKDQTARRVLLMRNEDDEMYPDLLILLPSKAGCDAVSIAVEIERTGKTQKRLLQKLRKYAAETIVDGVVYICDSLAISERLRQVYKSKVLERALRVKHYGNHFFLFSHGLLPINRDEPMMVNSNLEDISLTKWIHTLAETKNKARRDSNFDSRPSGAAH